MFLPMQSHFQPTMGRVWGGYEIMQIMLSSGLARLRSNSRWIHNRLGFITLTDLSTVITSNYLWFIGGNTDKQWTNHDQRWWAERWGGSVASLHLADEPARSTHHPTARSVPLKSIYTLGICASWPSQYLLYYIPTSPRQSPTTDSILRLLLITEALHRHDYVVGFALWRNFRIVVGVSVRIMNLIGHCSFHRSNEYELPVFVGLQLPNNVCSRLHCASIILIWHPRRRPIGLYVCKHDKTW